MGILFENGDTDQRYLKLIAEKVCDQWNTNGGQEAFGIKLLYSTDSIAQMSEEGATLLSSLQATQPGPFKRIATLLVLAKLHRLFSLVIPESSEQEGLKTLPLEKDSLWSSRPLYLLINQAFQVLRLRGRDEKEYQLGPWKGFPSFHSRAEFLQLLCWFCDMPNDVWCNVDRLDLEEMVRNPAKYANPSREDANFERRERMVLAVSLILEAVHYQQAPSGGCIAGFCDSALYELDEEMKRLVFFDAYLKKKTAK